MDIHYIMIYDDIYDYDYILYIIIYTSSIVDPL